MEKQHWLCTNCGVNVEAENSVDMHSCFSPGVESIIQLHVDQNNPTVISDMQLNASSSTAECYVQNQSSEWTVEGIKLLLQLYAENRTALSKKNCVKKYTWTKISERMKEANYTFSWDQLQNKWKSLSRTYRAIQGHSKQPGNRRNWPYFNLMDELLGSPKVDSLTIASSCSGENQRTAKPNKIRKSNEPAKFMKASSPFSENCGKKRPNSDSISQMLNELAMQRRIHHEQNLAEKKRFNNLLEILVSKLPNRSDVA